LNKNHWLACQSKLKLETLINPNININQEIQINIKLVWL